MDSVDVLFVVVGGFFLLSDETRVVWLFAKCELATARRAIFESSRGHVIFLTGQSAWPPC